MSQIGTKTANEKAPRVRGARIPLSPLIVLALALAGCLVLLVVPVLLPIGAMYWDLAVYLDGAQRVLVGQTPALDFFAPVGPLGYWLLAAGLRLFDDAQPLLLADWSILAVTAPAMALVVADISRRSRATALLLLLPFLAFQIMPMNVEQYSTFPSVDGYGIYNRQTIAVLYVLSTALVFCCSQRVLLAVLSWTMLALFLLKVTGFVAAGLLCALALANGRVWLRTAVAVAGVFAAALAVLEVTTGVVTAYVGDILVLVALNNHSLAPRFLQAASIHFGIFGSGCALILALLLSERSRLTGDLAQFRHGPFVANARRLLDRPVVWLGAGLVAGLFFETQNTGGQAFVFIWPMLLMVLMDNEVRSTRDRILVATLVAATALPPAVNTTHRFARAVVGQFQYEALPHTHLGQLGMVSQRPEAFERADKQRSLYIAYPQTFEATADLDILPTYSLYSEIEFQIGWLAAADEAADAILAYEAANDVRFETILNLNFANPFPLILDRQGPLHVAIGADPFRAIPPPDELTLASIRQTDLVLYPTCPITAANRRILAIYEAALVDHRRVTLSPCWIGYLRT